MKTLISSLLRDPLLHFLLIGVVFFILAPSAENTERTILLDEAEIAVLEQRFEWIEGHSPSAEERETIISSYIDEEILVREARRLGLHHNDPIVRRRLAQKMRRLLEQWKSAPPTDKDLQEWMESHPRRYTTPERRSIEQVFFSREKRGERCPVDALNAIKAIREGADTIKMGDPFLKGRNFVSKSETEFSALFGETLAKGVFQMEIGEWAGLPSPYGTHVIRVVNRVPGETPTLEELRPLLLQDWRTENKEISHRKALDALREEYTVEGP